MDLDSLMAQLRPRLHRYCARMTGSVIEGEDVVQEALLKAHMTREQFAAIQNPEHWLFRIAHNAALDHLRRRVRDARVVGEEDVDAMPSPMTPYLEEQAVAASLRTLMELPPASRAAVVLRDVLGYSTEETAGILDVTVPTVKSALQRGRVRLRSLANRTAASTTVALSPLDHTRWRAYIDRFNRRDFDGLRGMLADDVRLELVNRLSAGGERVREYYGRYASTPWQARLGWVDGMPAALVFDADDAEGRPVYFVLLEWGDGKIAKIRDFLFARYVMEDAEISVA